MQQPLNAPIEGFSSNHFKNFFESGNARIPDAFITLMDRYSQDPEDFDAAVAVIAEHGGEQKRKRLAEILRV